MLQSDSGRSHVRARYDMIAVLVCLLIWPGLAVSPRFSGLIAEGNEAHQVVRPDASGNFVPPIIDAPTLVNITITNPGPTHWLLIPKYGPTMNRTGNGYNPAQDCDGNFMSYKYQPNNNCYNYAVDIATNTFAQPGLASGNSITPETLNGPSMQQFAEQDGLIPVGTSIADIKTFATKRTITAGHPRKRTYNTPPLDGHFVALMISLASGNWTGDFHWARCDDQVNFDSWSQKDGTDAVTNFDHAGNLISDPSKANWAANQGPQGPKAINGSDLTAVYEFFTFMFVPHGAVKIL